MVRTRWMKQSYSTLALAAEQPNVIVIVADDLGWSDTATAAG